MNFNKVVDQILVLLITQNIVIGQTVINGNHLKIDNIVSQYVSGEEPGYSVALVDNGKLIFNEVYGLADLENTVPISDQTVFNVGSIAKQFTCFSILLLEKDGKLSLQDNINQYLPEVPDFDNEIRITHLVHHSSGLRDSFESLAISGTRIEDVVTKDHILSFIKNQKSLNFMPGEQFFIVILVMNYLRKL